MWFPLIGWLIGGYLQYGRIGRARLEVYRQLQHREHFPAEAWKAVGVDPGEAEKVARTVAARADWSNHHFLPDDSLMLLLLDEDGMGCFEASYAIGKEFDTAIRPDEIPAEGTFRDLVDRVYHPRPRESPTGSFK